MKQLCSEKRRQLSRKDYYLRFSEKQFVLSALIPAVQVDLHHVANNIPMRM